MIPKSGYRFSERDHGQSNKGRGSDSTTLNEILVDIPRQMPEAIAGLDQRKGAHAEHEPASVEFDLGRRLPGHDRIVDMAGDLTGLHLVAEPKFWFEDSVARCKHIVLGALHDEAAGLLRGGRGAGSRHQT